MPELITSKISVGISACLYRCPVRYNGKSFDGTAIMGRERSDYSFTPVCPECMAGLGVPRTPIHLTGTGQEVLAGTASVRDRRGRDVTRDLTDAAHMCMDTVSRSGAVAFIAKEASPSCGLHKARVGRRRTEQSGGSGVFGALLLESGLFLIPDTALSSPLLWWDARRRLHAWLWLRRHTFLTSKDAYDAWHILKFVVQELDRSRADAIGNALAALPKKPDHADLASIHAEILDSLATPSTKPRVRQAMWKTYVHARKKGLIPDGGIELTVTPPDLPETVDTVAAQLILMERVSFEHDIPFGMSPVLARDARRVAPRER